MSSPVSAIFVRCLFLTSMINIGWSYKILIIAPGLSNSQVVLNQRMGDLLASKGHEVTIYLPQVTNKITLKETKLAKLITYRVFKEGDPRPDEAEKMMSRLFEDVSVLEELPEFFKMIDYLAEACRIQLENEEVISQLRQQKFDLAIGHMYDMCPMGLVEALKIPTHIWMSSGILMDYMAWDVGLGLPYSHMPNALSSFGDRMTLSERLQNVMGVWLMIVMHTQVIIPKFNTIFRDRYGQQFPDLLQLAAKSPLIFTNSEELLDFPGPTLRKIIPVGGIDISNASPLNEEWTKLVDRVGKGMIFFSFGSIAPVRNMPMAWKLAFLEAFSQFPEYTFIWKHEIELPEAAKYKNVILTKWAPQKDLLAHPKMLAFITHCGLNSLMEAAANGVPLISLPLFGDQMGNFKRAERHGISVGISKTNVTVDNISKAIRTILADSSYAKNAKLLSRMLKNKPVKADVLLVNWVEFLAEYKTLPHLQPTSIEMNAFNYYMIDLFIIFLLVLTVIVTISFTCLCCLCRCICCRRGGGKKLKSS